MSKDRRSKHMKRFALCALTLQAFTIASTINVAKVSASEDDWHYVKKHEDCDDDSKKKGSSSGKLETPSGVKGDWLTEGTEEYKVAKRIFEIFTQEYGTSGAFAVGAISNSWGESGMIPDVLEGGVRAGMNTPDGPSYNSANPSDLGGGGLFQFTPYTKFSHSKWWKGRPGSNGWAIENQVDAVWGLEFGNRVVETYFSRTRKNNFSKVEDLISTEDPALASEYFQMAYERPKSFHAERVEWAKQANKVFNKDNIKADKSKWKFYGASSDGAVSKDSSKKHSDEDCEVVQDSAKAGWGEDGTGSYSQAGVWKPNDLPEELKKYAIDPESLGLKYRSSEGWPNPGNQCAHFSESMMAVLWEKDGKTHDVVRSMYGKQEADNHSAAFGGKVSKQPVKGAVSGTSSPYHPEAGHTYIVSHRFENGDILIVEQNVSGYSGEGNGESCTWNYRIVTKAEYEREGAKFYSPEGEGWKPSPKVKMKGA